MTTVEEIIQTGNSLKEEVWPQAVHVKKTKLKSRKKPTPKSKSKSKLKPKFRSRKRLVQNKMNQ